MGRDPDILVGLDLGTSKVSVVVAERVPESPGEARIIGIGEAPTRNSMQKGMIRDLGLAVDAVNEAIADVETSLPGLKISRVVVSFSGQKVICKGLHGSISLGDSPSPILPDKINEVIEDALSKIHLPAEFTCLHAIPIGYKVDGSSGIENPIEMTGTRLDVDLVAIAVPTSVAMNVVNCVEKAGVKVDGLVVKALAESLGILSKDERDIGETFISVGGGTTSAAVFSDGHLRYVAEFAIAGDHVTSDVMKVHQVPPHIAEEIKKKVNLEPGANNSGTVSVEAYGVKKDIDREDLANTVRGRIEELFEDIINPSFEAVKKAGLPTVAVMAGGVMLSSGIAELASEKLGMKVRVGRPVMYRSMPPGRNDCRYGALCGLLVYMLERLRNPYSYVEAPIGNFKNDKKQKLRSDQRVIKRKQRDTESLAAGLRRNIKELFRQLF